MKFIVGNNKIHKIILRPWKDKLRGNRNIAKGKIKQEWGELTDDDLDYREGEEDELLGRIQRKTGEDKERINRFLNDLKY